MVRGKRAPSPEEIKQALKKEIIRLGIADNPSRTLYQEKYRRGEAPSPNNVLKVTGEKWSDIVHELGFEYNAMDNIRKESQKNSVRNKGLEYKIRLTDPVMREKIIDRTLELMKQKNIVLQKDLRKILRPNVGISYSTLVSHGYTFEVLKKLYTERYGEKIRSAGDWSNVNNKELLDIVIVVMKKINTLSLYDYNQYRKHSKEKLPSVTTLMGRFNMTYAEVSKMIQALL